LLKEERERSKNLNNRLNEEVSSRLLVDERYDEKAAELCRHKEALKEAQERLDYVRVSPYGKVAMLSKKGTADLNILIISRPRIGFPRK